jgi:hypothetical protein
MGWSGKKNGELLQLMKGENFNVLLTTDQNLQHQQNFLQVGIVVIVMVAPSNRLPELLPLLKNVRKALERIARGEVVEVIEIRF